MTCHYSAGQLYKCDIIIEECCIFTKILLSEKNVVCVAETDCADQTVLSSSFSLFFHFVQQNSLHYYFAALLLVTCAPQTQQLSQSKKHAHARGTSIIRRATKVRLSFLLYVAWKAYTAALLLLRFLLYQQCLLIASCNQLHNCFSSLQFSGKA